MVEEPRRLVTWSEHQRRLLARIVLAFCLLVVVDFVGGLMMWALGALDFQLAHLADPSERASGSLYDREA